MTQDDLYMEVGGGPFDFKVSRDHDTITLSVIGKHGDLITSIDFNAGRIDNVILALMEARNSSAL